MSSPQTQQTITQRTTLIDEEFAPPPPAPSGPAGEIPDLLTGSPLKNAPGGSAPGTGSCLVRPELEGMLQIIDTTINVFIKGRNEQLNELEHILQRNACWVDDACNKIDEIENANEEAKNILPQFIEMYGAQHQYYQDQYELATNPSEPIPNLRALNHPSPEITQENFINLIYQGAVLCNHSERQARIAELMFNHIAELMQNTRHGLDAAAVGLEYYMEMRDQLQRENEELLSLVIEKQHEVTRFLDEWQRGGPELDQTPPQNITPDRSGPYATSTPTKICSPGTMPSSRVPSPNVSPICPPAALPSSPVSPTGMPRRSRGPSLNITPVCSPNTSSSSQGTPIEELQDRVGRLRGRAHLVEDLVRRYNDLHGVIMHEIQNLRDHNDTLDESQAAMQGIPDSPDAPAG